MIEKAKKNCSHKRGRISEEDISCLLQRYTATTVLTLLQEVGQFEGVKIDWNAIVRKTSTGISSAREYQMLWRYLAYRHCLTDKLDDAAQLLDNDSDLDYELEVYPEVNSEASAEAAACVKVLMASGLPTDTNQTNAETVEAPLTINIPNGHSFRPTSDNSRPAAKQGVNITIPVSVQKQPMPTVSEGMDVNGSQTSNNQSRRKRKPWSEAEDLELVAAVRKFGEGNWANIVKGEFKGDRTPSQLSQRWAIIRKKNYLSIGSSSSNSQLSEVQRAARHAMNMALDPPTRNTFANSTGGTPSSSNSKESLVAKQEPQKRPAVTRYSIMGSMGSVDKGALAQPNLGSDPVRAAAVAAGAGARIASQSDAASLLKVAKANNAVHIMPKSSPSTRPSLHVGASTRSEIRPKVHNHPSAGVASAPRSPCTEGPRNASPSTTMQRPQMSIQPSKTSTEHCCSEIPQERAAKTVGGVEVSSLGNARKAEAQEVGDVKDDKSASGSKEPERNVQMPVTEGHGPVPKLEKADNCRVDPPTNKPEEARKENDSKNASSYSSQVKLKTNILPRRAKRMIGPE